MALLRGALSMMKLPHIDLLVVGLPVALLALKQASLEKAMVGGGPFLFNKAVKAAFPKHRIHEVKEPLFANVLGDPKHEYTRELLDAAPRFHSSVEPTVA